MPESPHPLQLNHEGNHWIIPLQGWKVTQIQIDYAFGLSLWGSVQAQVHFRIGGRFSFRHGQETHELHAEEEPRAALAPALALLGRELESAVAYESGALELAFNEDMSLFVPADPHYEAWEASGIGHRLISLPGGGLSFWLPD